METRKTRGRPRTFDRQAALDAAMELFWRHGYEGTSIADLTDAMGFTPPTLYAAFGSKEQLYRDVLERYLERGEQGRAGWQTEAGSTRELFEQYLRKVAERFTDPTRPAGCMVQTASLYCATENEGARTIAADMRAIGLAALVAVLERAQAAGELPAATDVRALARFYNAVIQGMSVQAIDGASAEDLNRVVDVALLAWPSGPA